MHTTLGAPGSTGLVKVVNGIIQAPATLLVNADVSDTAAILVSKISGAAPLASPAFTGTVTIGTLSGLLRATAGVIAGSATVALGSEVTGTLPVGNGGTGATTLTGYVKGNGASAMTASLTIPTSDLFGNIALGSQVSGTLPIANGGTNNASLVVTQGTVYYGDGSKLLGLAPGTPGQVLQSQGSAAPQWAGVPYDLSAASAGTYSNSQVIFRYIAPRAVTITSTGSYFKCVTASSGTVTAAVAQSGSASTSFNVTFSVAGGTTGSVPTGTTIAMAAGDILTVTMPASANSSLAGVYFTLKGTGV
jgi:hypothetical protein